MARSSPADFVKNILLDGLGASGVVVGPDFEFGKGRAGKFSTLKEMGAAQGFSVTCFDMVTTSNVKISSTRIREALKAARPEEAASLLGHWWAVEARVEHGDGRGRTMGFPTANMHLGHCLAPAFGVYAVRVTILDNDKPVSRHDGVANFGIRPMYQTQVPLMEAHLFDFEGDLYGKHLMVELISYIRPEAKFDGLDALIAQIARDATQAREILAKTGAPPMLDA
jgi:riboflavin kinase/FMN adenylyltransferase